MGSRYREYLMEQQRKSRFRNVRNSGDAAVDMERQMRQIIRRINSLPDTVDRDLRKKIMTQAAAPLIEAAKALAPTEKRNRTVSISSVDSKGKRTTTKYLPGNLKKSIRILEFKKSPDIFVGPRVVKRSKAKTYGRSERNTNAFYAHWVEFGRSGRYTATPYMRPAFERTKHKILQIATKQLAYEIAKWSRKMERQAKTEKT